MARFTLSFRKMALWSLTVMGLVGGVSLLVMLVCLMAMYLLSRLPLESALAPIMLAVMTVGLMLGILIPALLIIVGLVAWGLQYELTEESLIQHVGPFKFPMDWLMMEKMVVEHPLNLGALTIEQWQFWILKKDRPIVIFSHFLAEPDGFLQTLKSVLPREHAILKSLS